jgi:hypothetical protein
MTMRIGMSNLTHDDLDQVISTKLRWKLFHEIKCSSLVKAWYHDKRPSLTEPMNFTENMIKEAYLYEY